VPSRENGAIARVQPNRITRSRHPRLVLESRVSVRQSVQPTDVGTRSALRIYLYLKHFPSQPGEASQLVGEGTAKAVHGLAAGLAGLGAEVTVLCEHERRVSRLTPDGYVVECFPTSVVRPAFAISKDLERFIEDSLGPSDVIVLNGIFHPSVYAMARILRRQRLGYIIQPHDPYHPSIFRTRWYLKWPYWYLVERPTLTSARAIQLLDAQHAQWLRRLGVNTPCITVPNGFLPADVPPTDILRWADPSQAPALFFLGRLDAYNKGIDILLDAFAGLRAKTEATLTIQGRDAGDRSTLRRRVEKLGLGRAVRFLEPDYDQTSSELIAKYDVLCSPSRFEGFGLAALEAMLAARVLLVSEVAGIARHVRASGCGVIVNAEPAAVRAGLEALLLQRLAWRDMGLAGRQYAIKQLSWRTIAASALVHYRELAG
jgi:glycosyltransferase involved in cell wall biosynthesis